MTAEQYLPATFDSAAHNAEWERISAASAEARIVTRAEQIASLRQLIAEMTKALKYLEACAALNKRAEPIDEEIWGNILWLLPKAFRDTGPIAEGLSELLTRKIDAGAKKWLADFHHHQEEKERARVAPPDAPKQIAGPTKEQERKALWREANKEKDRTRKRKWAAAKRARLKANGETCP